MDTTGEVKVEAGQSAVIDKLSAALAKAQGMFEQPKNIKRGQQGHRTFKYAPLPEIYRAIRPGLSQNELVDVSYWEEINGKLYMTTELRHSGGGVMVSRWPVSCTTDPQERGKEGTYGRRNNICALTGVVGEELDADDGDGEGERDADEVRRKEAEKKLDELKGKGRVQSAYDGKVLEPGEATLPAQRAGNVATLDQKPKTIDKGNGAGNSKERVAPGAEVGKEGGGEVGKTAHSAVLQKKEGRVAARSAPPTGNEGADKSDPLAGITMVLADLMRRDGITAEALKAYYVGKGHLPNTVEPASLPADYIVGLTKPENWKKAVTAIKGGK